MLTYQQCSRINHYVQGSSGIHDFYSCLVTVTISLESEYGKTRQQKNNEQDHLNILEKACFENSNALANKRSSWI